jgi:hypothetical protein
MLETAGRVDAHEKQRWFVWQKHKRTAVDRIGHRAKPYKSMKNKIYNSAICPIILTIVEHKRVAVDRTQCRISPYKFMGSQICQCCLIWLSGQLLNVRDRS